MYFLDGNLPERMVLQMSKFCENTQVACELPWPVVSLFTLLTVKQWCHTLAPHSRDQTLLFFSFVVVQPPAASSHAPLIPFQVWGRGTHTVK